MAYIVGTHMGNNVANPDIADALFAYSNTSVSNIISDIYPNLSRPLSFDLKNTADILNERQDFEASDAIDYSTMKHTHRFTLRDSDHVGPSVSTLDFIGFNNIPGSHPAGQIEMPGGHRGGLNYYNDSINGGDNSFVGHPNNPTFVGNGAASLISTPIKTDGKFYWEMRIDKMPTSCDSLGGNTLAWNYSEEIITDEYEGGTQSETYRKYYGADIELMFARRDNTRNREFGDGNWEAWGMWLRSFEPMTPFSKRLRTGIGAVDVNWNIGGDIVDSNEVGHTQDGDILMFAYDGVEDVNGETRLFVGRNGTWLHPAAGDSSYFRFPGGLGASYNPADDSAGAAAYNAFGWQRPGAKFNHDRDRDLRMFLSPMWGAEATDSSGNPQLRSSIDFEFSILVDSDLVYSPPPGFISH